MNQCPHHKKIREGLPPLTDRIAALPVDKRGYPIPFFVDYVNGEPEFRMMDFKKLVRCHKEGLCWVCGQPRGVYMAFVIGPMCAINRTTAEMPSHLECAEWSVKACPFLSNADMKRREDELTRANEGNVAGIGLKRNPGVMLIWITKTYVPFSDGKGGVLFRVGDPVRVSWWKEGRSATRAEIEESINSGLPLLREMCDQERPERREAAVRDLERALGAMRNLLPQE